MLGFEELLTQVGNEIDELKEAVLNPEVDKAKRKVLSELIASYESYTNRTHVEWLAKIVFCGWALTSCTELERNRYLSFRKSELRSLVINGFDENYLLLANQLRDHLFLNGEDDNAGPESLKDLMLKFARKVGKIIETIDEDMSSDMPGVTWRNLLNVVMAKCPDKPRTPLLDLYKDLIGVKTGPKHRNRRSAELKNVNAGMVTLKDWLALNGTSIIKNFTIKSQLMAPIKKDGKLVAAPDDNVPYLSNDFKKIMSSVTCELKVLHDHGFIHGNLCEETIMIRLVDLEVKLSHSFELGDPKTDCQCLKNIINNAVKGKTIPSDLYHFVGEKTKSNRMYMHSAFWSPSDMIFLVDQLAAGFDRAGENALDEWLAYLPDDIELTMTNTKAKYKFLDDFFDERSMEYQKYQKKAIPLLFMRDGIHHIDKHVKEKSDTPEESFIRVTRMVELFCPHYLANLMVIIGNMVEWGHIHKSPVIKKAIESHFDLLRKKRKIL